MLVLFLLRNHASFDPHHSQYYMKKKGSSREEFLGIVYSLSTRTKKKEDLKYPNHPQKKKTKHDTVFTKYASPNIMEDIYMEDFLEIFWVDDEKKNALAKKKKFFFSFLLMCFDCFEFQTLHRYNSPLFCYSYSLR